jgi:REP element-mobilizing transposase RayT
MHKVESHPECKYHVVFIPKCRGKTLYVQLRQYLGEVFGKLAEQKESRIEEGHLPPRGAERNAACCLQRIRRPSS